jgi:arsenate reductase-like glutaredoxin family protein
MSAQVQADKLASVYIKMRDKRKEILAEFEAQDSKIEAQMEMVAEELLKLCKDIGADSIKTQAGTVFRSVRTRYETTDWESMYNFILEHDIPQVLERRISTTNMKQFLDENPTLMPIGMNVNNRYTVTVRRK